MTSSSNLMFLFWWVSIYVYCCYRFMYGREAFDVWNPSLIWTSGNVPACILLATLFSQRLVLITEIKKKIFKRAWETRSRLPSWVSISKSRLLFSWERSDWNRDPKVRNFSFLEWFFKINWLPGCMFSLHTNNLYRHQTTKVGGVFFYFEI